MTDAEYLEVSTATETKDQAVALARVAVEGRLAAGAQITGPVTSVFWHAGEFGTGEEWRLVLRTHVSRLDELRTALVGNHPWQKPEVIATPIVASTGDYLDWIRKSVSEN